MPESELKGAVARLARYGDEDIEAVLARLEPGHRARLRGLLAEQTGRAARVALPHGASKQAAAAPDLHIFSPWLAARIEAALTGRSEGRFNNATFSLAPAARMALAAEAGSLPRPADSPGQPAFVRRLAGLFRKAGS